MKNGNTYIYALIDIRDIRIRYIGKSNNPQKRYKEHLKPYSLKYTSHKNSWLKQLLNLNLKPIMIILEEIDQKNWEQREKYWINFYGRDNLANSTDGGDGFKDSTGNIAKKISKSRKGIIFSDEQLKNMSSARMGKSVPSDVRKKISEANKGRPKPDGFGENLSKARKGQTVSLEQREKISRSLTGRSLSEERKIKDRDSLRGYKKNKNTSSKYVGVYLDKSRNKWQSHIKIEKNTYKFLGRFENEEDAARAYNAAALTYFGPNARLNIID